MASLVLRGSDVADATLTNACDMSLNTTGGAETSKTTTTTGFNIYAEFFSQGGSTTGFNAIPATPSGKGWTYQPGAGTFANAAWSATANLIETGGSSGGGDNDDITIRFFRYDGTYHSIGTILNNTDSVTSSKTAIAFSATTMPLVTFGSSDLLYVDLWWHDGGSIDTDNPAVYESTSSSTGVSGDMEITTSSFTASGGGVTQHIACCDGFGGVFR